MFGGKKSEGKVDVELFTFYDCKSQLYGTPSFAVNRHDLIRELMNMFRNPEQQARNTLYINAEDFTLFKIGSYDKSSGKIVVDPTHEHVANLIDLRSSVQAEQAKSRAVGGPSLVHPD